MAKLAIASTSLGFLVINREIFIPKREIGRFSLFDQKSGDLPPNRETWKLCTWKCFCICVCVIWDKAIKDFCTDFPQERMWVPWEATHQLIKSNQAISCSELILSRGQTDKGMPFYPLPKNHSSKSIKSHALVITCVHIILKKSNKSIV